MGMTSAEVRSFWEGVWDAFDPIEPVKDPAIRVRRNRHYSPAEEVVPTLLRPFRHERRSLGILVAGGIGSGKSTELLAIAERLAEQRTVVVIDVWRHMERSVGDAAALQHLQPWELLGIVGLALLRAGTERYNHPWDGGDQQLARALTAGADDPGPGELDVGRLARGLTVAVAGGVAPGASAVAAAGLQLLEAVTGAWSWKVGLPGARGRSDQDEGVKGVLAATSTLVRSLEDGLDRKVVVVLDGLDRLKDHDAFQRLFLRSRLLTSMPCDVVVGAHLAMVQRHRSDLQQQFEPPRYLTNEPVARRDDPWAPGAGVAFFRELVDLRLRRLAQGGVRVVDGVFPDALVTRLAWCSGGRIRDFIGFIRRIAEESFDNAADKVTDALVDRVVDKARRDAADGLTKDEIDLLCALAMDPHHRLPGGELALDLLERQLLLPYPNDDQWYLPHPLLLITLIRPGCDRSGGSSA